MQEFSYTMATLIADSGTQKRSMSYIFINISLKHVLSLISAYSAVLETLLYWDMFDYFLFICGLFNNALVAHSM
jgi:hypothetical protein